MWVNQRDVSVEVTPSSIHINVDGYMDIKRTFWGVDSGTGLLNTEMLNTKETCDSGTAKDCSQHRYLSLYDKESKGQITEQGMTLKAVQA